MNKIVSSNRFYVGIFYSLNGFLAIFMLTTNNISIYLSILLFFLTLVIVTNLVFGIRTRNPWFLLTAAHYSNISLAILFELYQLETAKKLFMILFIVTCLSLIIAGMKKKLKWRKYEILELAAQSVSSQNNGFTNRPMVCGHTDLPFKDILAFWSFARRHLLGIPRIFPDRAELVLTEHTLPYLLGVPLRYNHLSWICITKKGKITVYLSQQDYARFKEKLTFDQLCMAICNQFVNWIKNYSQGSDRKMIDQLNQVHSIPFTGGLIGF